MIRLINIISEIRITNIPFKDQIVRDYENNSLKEKYNFISLKKNEYILNTKYLKLNGKNVLLIYIVSLDRDIDYKDILDKNWKKPYDEVPGFEADFTAGPFGFKNDQGEYDYHMECYLDNVEELKNLLKVIYTKL